MNTGTERIAETAKKIFFKFFPICVFFYLILSRHFPRNIYPLINTEILNDEITLANDSFESCNKLKIRKKLIHDLKIHGTDINLKKKQVTKLFVNKQGKIIGYKFYSLFYPNYFTKIQNKNVITDTRIIKNYKNFFLIVINYN